MAPENEFQTSPHSGNRQDRDHPWCAAWSPVIIDGLGEWQTYSLPCELEPGHDGPHSWEPPVSWRLVSGTLPDGLTLSTPGMLAGQEHDE